MLGAPPINVVPGAPGGGWGGPCLTGHHRPWCPETQDGFGESAQIRTVKCFLRTHVCSQSPHSPCGGSRGDLRGHLQTHPHTGLHAHAPTGRQCSLRALEHLPQAGKANFRDKVMGRQHLRGTRLSGREPRETPPWKLTVRRQTPPPGPAGEVTWIPRHPPSRGLSGLLPNRCQARLGAKAQLFVSCLRSPAKAAQAPGGGAHQPPRGRAGACLRSARPQVR